VRPGGRRLLGQLDPVAEPDQLLRRGHLQQHREQVGLRRVRVPGQPPADVLRAVGPVLVVRGLQQPQRLQHRPVLDDLPVHERITVRHGRPHGGIEVLLLGGQVPGQLGADHLGERPPARGVRRVAGELPAERE
jgi:hypothetical protein